ncbi:MAG: hypothetical protein ACFCD0_00260 [Gemmataceae bacterium]
MDWFWKSSSSSPTKYTPFTIPCNCGHVLTGTRKATHQILVCPACKSKRFVLPLSPFSEIIPQQETSQSTTNSKVPSLFLERAAMVGIVIVFLALLTGTVVPLCFPTSSSTKPASQAPKLTTVKAKRAIQKHQQHVKECISRGQFYLAQSHLKTIANFHKYHPEFVANTGTLVHQLRELAIFADLLAPGLEDLLDQAIDLDKDDWVETLRNRYQGKSVILDTYLRVEGGTLVSDYRIYGKDRCVATIQVRNLVALERYCKSQIKQQEGEPERIRVLFGARLEALEPVGPKVWRIRFERKSGVILTNYEALLVCCPGSDDQATAACMRRQCEWVLREKKGVPE